uniref:Dystrophin related protein 2 n=1 Tax=Hucho hucho TaxID=62062 RepID=A0A4W5QSP7_9TELE
QYAQIHTGLTLDIWYCTHTHTDRFYLSLSFKHTHTQAHTHTRTRACTHTNAHIDTQLTLGILGRQFANVTNGGRCIGDHEQPSPNCGYYMSVSVCPCVRRVRLEAFSDNSGKLQLSLQEIIEWLTAKDEELSEQLPIGGDVGAVQHQREFHQVFMEDVKSRGPFIYSVLESAQVFLAQHPFQEPEETLPDGKEVSPRKRILNVSRSVWKQANVASDLWEKLTARCVDRHRHMERTLERLLQTQAAMEELAVALEQAEGVRDAWEPVGDLFIDSLQDHIDATKLFKEELTQVKEGMKHINDLAHELAVSDVHLSMDNAHSLEHLNSRWKLLLGSIEERLKQLQDAHRDFGPGSQHFLSSKGSSTFIRSWRRVL